MPDPKDNAKLTGDTHLPDVEDDGLEQEEASSGNAPQARPRSEEGRPGRGARKAGVVRDHDDAPGDDAGGKR
jgi:hypothetical protein